MLRLCLRVRLVYGVDSQLVHATAALASLAPSAIDAAIGAANVATTVAATSDGAAAFAAATIGSGSISAAAFAAAAVEPAAFAASADASAPDAAAAATDSAAPVRGDCGRVPDEWSCDDRVLGRDDRSGCGALLP